MFWHRQRDIKRWCTQERFRIFRRRSELERLCRSLQKKFETKMVMVGEDADLAKEARVVNRIVRWHPRKGATYEANPRHAEIIRRETGAEELETI